MKTELKLLLLLLLLLLSLLPQELAVWVVYIQWFVYDGPPESLFLALQITPLPLYITIIARAKMSYIIHAILQHCKFHNTGHWLVLFPAIELKTLYRMPSVGKIW